MSWELGQTLYRMEWRTSPYSDVEDKIIVIEFTVESPTPTGGWIVETDCYSGEKPDRSKGNLRPMATSSERVWRKDGSNYVHATLESARDSLVIRTRRHMKHEWIRFFNVQKRCDILGIDAEKCKPDRILSLRRANGW